jgi:hypothetical protein
MKNEEGMSQRERKVRNVSARLHRNFKGATSLR